MTLMQQTGGTLGDRWFWSITCVLTEATPMIGYGETREEAQAQFAAAHPCPLRFGARYTRLGTSRMSNREGPAAAPEGESATDGTA